MIFHQTYFSCLNSCRGWLSSELALGCTRIVDAENLENLQKIYQTGETNKETNRNENSIENDDNELDESEKSKEGQLKINDYSDVKSKTKGVKKKEIGDTNKYPTSHDEGMQPRE